MPSEIEMLYEQCQKQETSISLEEFKSYLKGLALDELHILPLLLKHKNFIISDYLVPDVFDSIRLGDIEHLSKQIFEIDQSQKEKINRIYNLYQDKSLFLFAIIYDQLTVFLHCQSP